MHPAHHLTDWTATTPSLFTRLAARLTAMAGRLSASRRKSRRPLRRAAAGPGLPALDRSTREDLGLAPPRPAPSWVTTYDYWSR